MRGWQRRDYPFFGGKTPYQRHVEHQRPDDKQWNTADDQVTQEDIDIFRRRDGPELEFYIHRSFLTRREVRRVLAALNVATAKSKKRKSEYYASLPEVRDRFCIPAMEDVVAKKFRTMREAVVQRLRESGIGLDVQNDGK